MLPLTNDSIAAVAGKVIDDQNRIIDYGVFLQDGVVHPAFRGEAEHHAGLAGATGWYRNAAAAAGGVLAFRRAVWEEIGGLAAVSNMAAPTTLSRLR